ncbi:MAG: LamG domain-containing protein, partial [Thermoplasmata archaeon]|nr:LamG domain-containing protein [Thermoplasmata archaeon]
MQRKFFSIAMIGLLIFSALNLNIFLTQEIESQNNSELLDNKENNIGTRAIEGGGPSRTLPESTSHGGSWLDSFEDDTGITWSLSNNFRLIGGDVKMMEESPPFNVDPYTVALWHFDEGSGTIAYDETLNNNDGTLGGDGIGPDLPTWTTGKFGGGLDFDGINDHILVPDKNEFSIDTTGEFTVDFWVKTGNDITSRQEMICKGGQSTSDPYEWCIRIMNGNFVATFCNPSGANIRNENVPVSMNTWYYFMVVYNGYTKDDDIEIYCNGVESSLIANQASYTYSNTNGELGMGRLYTTSGGWNHFSGILDEIRISNITRRPFYNKSTLISKPINIPPGMAWDSIILNKTLPNNTYLNVTILNATNNQPIPGAPKYINNGEFDISYINPTQNPSIRMKAGFKGNSTVSPVFHYWGVSWNASNAWKDSFFGGVKVEGSNNVGILDGNAKLLMNKYDMEDNLAGLWHFDEGSGTIAYDETSNNNDGTLGGDGIGSDLPTWTTGKFG